MQETWVQSLIWEDPLEKGMATHSSILAWRIPWTKEPGWGCKELDKSWTELDKTEWQMTENEMVGWHHQISGHEFKQTLGDGDGQGSLTCCSPWGYKESDRLSNWTTTAAIPGSCMSSEPWIWLVLQNSGTNPGSRDLSKLGQISQYAKFYLWPMRKRW